LLTWISAEPSAQALQYLTAERFSPGADNRVANRAEGELRDLGEERNEMADPRVFVLVPSQRRNPDTRDSSSFVV